MAEVKHELDTRRELWISSRVLGTKCRECGGDHTGRRGGCQCRQGTALLDAKALQERSHRRDVASSGSEGQIVDPTQPERWQIGLQDEGRRLIEGEGNNVPLIRTYDHLWKGTQTLCAGTSTTPYFVSVDAGTLTPLQPIPYRVCTELFVLQVIESTGS
jgi:hypothetical protein